MTALTQSERRWVWISAAIFLLVLLALFFAGLFVDIKVDAPFLPGFYFIANVIAATAAGILASTISGFFKIELENRLSRNGRLLVQATGGFAVFVMVIWMNPQNSMFDLADKLFSSLVLDCQHAVESPGVHPNAEALCRNLADAYPMRPEPWRLMARLTHRRQQAEGFETAAELYGKSIGLYGFDVAELNREVIDDAKLSPYDKIQLSETISGYSVASADSILTRYSRGGLTLDATLIQLDTVEGIIDLNLHLIGSDGDPFIVGRMLDVSAKISLYKSYLDEASRQTHLGKAADLYRRAIEVKPFYVLFLKYHYFLTRLLQKTYAPQTDTDPGRDFSDFLSSWEEFTDHIENLAEIAVLREFSISMLRNSRKEGFRVSRPFGSKLFGGKEFVDFIQSRAELMDRFREKLHLLCTCVQRSD